MQMGYHVDEDDLDRPRLARPRRLPLIVMPAGPDAPASAGKADGHALCEDKLAG
jgi:hypothetical protein